MKNKIITLTLLEQFKNRKNW